jgi:hypothetical protein
LFSQNSWSLTKRFFATLSFYNNSASNTFCFLERAHACNAEDS